jgi:hypothetical protein
LRKTITRALKKNLTDIDFEYFRKLEKAQKRGISEVPPSTLTQKILNFYDPNSKIRPS